MLQIFITHKNIRNQKIINFINQILIIKKKIKTIFNKYKPLALFNLAAETHVDRSIDNPDEFIKSNIFGVYNLLEIFKEFQKKTKNLDSFMCLQMRFTEMC